MATILILLFILFILAGTPLLFALRADGLGTRPAPRSHQDWTEHTIR